MENSLDIILDRLFDYAGMFPPAARSFEAALRESAELSRSLLRPFMLNSDIVLDTSHAHALWALNLRSFGFAREVSVALLATSEIGDVLDAAQKLRGARSTPGDVRCRVSSIELKLQDSGFGSNVRTLCDYCSRHQILLAVEPDLSTSSWNETLEKTVENLTKLSTQCALKCRGSGPTGIGPERLARALCRVSEVGIPFKVTGGFHHPIVESAHYGNIMGFLNLVVAVMLRRIRASSFSESDVAALLVNSNPSAFTWGDSLQYGLLSISCHELRLAKAKTSFSIGSCSLAEPDQDLTRLYHPS